MLKSTFVALATLGVLSFCDTAEERAEAHFQSGMELLGDGDVDRALVEFRNVFQLDGLHREARLAYADAERARGNMGEAYGQYLRLVEQYPDSLPGQRALAEMSVENRNWDAARRHGDAAAELAPDDPLIKAVNAAVDYRAALADRDEEARREVVTLARQLVSENPELLIARRVVIDDLVRAEDWSGALSAVDAAIAEHPGDRELYTLRLGMLAQLGEIDEIRAQLEDMIERFPDDPNVPATLVRWYLSQGDADSAEAFLRERAEEEPREADNIVTLIRFLAEVRSTEAARAELDRVLATDPPAADRLRALNAAFRFDLGERDAAISSLEALIEGAEPSDERRTIMVMLAQMLESTGNRVGARALVEDVLEEDAGHTEALKMRAGWLIENDRVDDAIVALRSALGSAPDDADAMTLMARAHERAGNRELMADMLGRAVDASNNAPVESLRYARYLMGEGNLRSAESVLINALRLAPGNVGVLAALGEIYVRDEDWPRLTQVIETIRGRDAPAAEAVANELTAQQLAAEGREDELMGFLENLASDGERGIGAAAAIVRTRLAEGDAEGAVSYAEEVLTENPESYPARFLLASVRAVTGDLDTAEATFRELTAESPGDQSAWMALYNVVAATDGAAASRQVLEDGVAANPDAPQLNWALAGIMERDGDIDGAIEIYERLYEANGDNLIIANNLASLLSTSREDAESLARAHEIARRLRGREVPAFQDTYGWIAFRRGDIDSALAALEPAAAGLPSDPAVQYHLARTYAELGRTDDALAQFRRVVEVVGDGPRPAFMDEVEAEIARLEAGPAEEGAQN